MIFNEIFEVARSQRASDGQGGWMTAYVEVARERGRMTVVGANEQRVGGQLQERVTHVLFARARADIARGDRVTGSRSGAMLILGVRRPSRRDHIEVDCREYQAGA
jgi:head-tail adaptor